MTIPCTPWYFLALTGEWRGAKGGDPFVVFCSERVGWSCADGGGGSPMFPLPLLEPFLFTETDAFDGFESTGQKAESKVQRAWTYASEA